jgi:hypothetical protein
MEFNVPASWLQSSIIEHIVKVVSAQASEASEGNPVSAVPGKVKEDGRLAIVWSWKPAGSTKMSDVRRGEMLYTPEEAVVSYVASLKRTQKK